MVGVCAWADATSGRKITEKPSPERPMPRPNGLPASPDAPRLDMGSRDALCQGNEHIATSATRPGWTVGGGVEWAFWDNWSAKVEYDYYDFSTLNLSLPGTIAGVPEVVPGVNVKQTIQTVKFGINYRFGAY